MGCLGDKGCARKAKAKWNGAGGENVGLHLMSNEISFKDFEEVGVLMCETVEATSLLVGTAPCSPELLSCSGYAGVPGSHGLVLGRPVQAPCSASPLEFWALLGDAAFSIFGT